MWRFGPSSFFCSAAETLSQAVARSSLALLREKVNDTIFTYEHNGRLLSENHPEGPYKRAYFYLYDIPVGMYLNESN
jgi:hypothetical protein